MTDDQDADARRLDAQTSALLVVRADVHEAFDDAISKRAGGILRAFSTFEGRRLRTWVIKLSPEEAGDKQTPAEPPGLESPASDEQRHERESLESDEQRIVRPVHPDSGNTALPAPQRRKVFRSVDLLERLAFWLARKEELPAWRLPGSTLLPQVAKTCEELVRLLEQDGGPEWPSAIELFDRSARPVIYGPSAAQHAACVSDPLRRQSVIGLLRNLAAETERLQRRNGRDQAVKFTPRPRSRDATDRRLARFLSDWLDHEVPEEHVPNEVLADMLSLARRPDDRMTKDDLSGSTVQRWLKT